MIKLRLGTALIGCVALASVCAAQNPHRMVAIWPWTFENGNRTSRTMVVETIRKIAEHHGFNVLSQHEMERRYELMNPAVSFRGNHPDLADLGRYASTVAAGVVIGGHVSWDTRSIWVGTGPKTISTARVELYVYDASSGAIAYEGRGEGRSDERESALKDVGDVLVTPWITVVSGGPATPREQRAAQIAIARALRPWVAGLPRPR